MLAGEFPVVNKYLLKDMVDLGIWTAEVRNQLIADKGSVQNIAELPAEYKALYKTTWEIKQRCVPSRAVLSSLDPGPVLRCVLDMAADRGAFICQSQSLNIHMGDPTPSKLTSMHFHAWRKGLKTGMYYLRTRPKADAIAFTVDQQSLEKKRKSFATPLGKAILKDATNVIAVTPTPKKPADLDEGICLSCGA